MGDGETAREKLELARDMELLVEEIYTLIAHRFVELPETRAVFERLAREEHQHALRVEMLARSYLHHRKAVDLVLDVTPMLQLKREAETVRARLQDGAPLTEAEARRLMLKIEEKFARAHAHNLAAISDPQIRELFELLAKQDQQHAALLGGRYP